MNIVFMGTPTFALNPLEKLIQSQHTVVGVFCQPDKPKGRGYRLTPPPVKQMAQQHNIPVFQPATLRTPEALQILTELSADVIVVVAYGKILPKEILCLPRLGCINIHASLLPKYRGAAPIQWSIIQGETVTGGTSMYMAEGLDTGDMILKKETPIALEETADQLTARLSTLGAECLIKTLCLLEKGQITREKQDDALSCYAPLLTKENTKINFNLPAQQVYNQIRGLSSLPGAYTYLEGKKLKVFHSKIVNSISGEPGTILDEKTFLVACAQGAVEFTQLQLEGAKRMDAATFLRGRKIKAGTLLGASAV